MDGILESFIFGFANSLHCAGMCGPLAACAAGAGGSIWVYQGSRVAAYGVAGVVAGAVGGAVGADAVAAPGVAVAFLLAGGLLLVVFGAGRPLASAPWLASAIRPLYGRLGRLPAPARAASWGALTPILPCGLLAAIYLAAFAAGGWRVGGLVMLGFALGSLPALLLAQTSAAWLGRRLSPQRRQRLHRGLALVAALVLLWRGIALLGDAPCH